MFVTIHKVTDRLNIGTATKQGNEHHQAN